MRVAWVGSGYRAVQVRQATLTVMSTLFIVVTALAVGVSPADARRRHHRSAGGGGGYAPPYAAMVVDAKTGRTLHAVNEDELRHPASITKVMTLYMLFERLERGQVTLTTPLRVSANAARQAPSKIGFEPGDTIEVEDAIKALVTKSANDVAVTVAENLAGTEEAFAEQMTRKAHALGMSRTHFNNASGLPDVEQVTTARDLVTLGRSLQDRFPQYYPYFGTRVFHYAGAAHRNHNKLLGRVDGVDGIKTGYTRMSGFNLLTSAQSEDRHVIGVVLGGRSGPARDKTMASLLETHLPRAFAGLRTAPKILDAGASDKARPAVIAAAPRNADTANDVTPSAAIISSLARPAFKPETVKPEPVRQETLADRSSDRTRDVPAEPLAFVASSAAPDATPSPIPAAVKPQPVSVSTATPSSSLRWIAGPQAVVKTASLSGPLPPMPSVEAPKAENQRIAMVYSQKDESRVEPIKETSAPRTEKSQAVAHASLPIPETTGAIPLKTSPHKGWQIQLGATEEEEKAKDILSRAKAASQQALKGAQAYTEKVSKGGSTLFRARFAGFDEADEAQAACKSLKRSGFSCFATRG